MAVNKVIYGDETLVDLTGDTVTPETLAAGATAHNAQGEQITGTMESGEGTGGGLAVQQQADYLQNDSTKVDHIKNRPFYTSAKQTHIVTFGDENTDYWWYKVGDFVPITGAFNDLTIHIDLGTGEISHYKCSSECAIPAMEGASVSYVIVDGMPVGAVYFVFSDLIDEGLPCGIYITDYFGQLDDAISNGEISLANVEIDFSFRKLIEPDFAPVEDSRAVKIYHPSSWAIGDDIPIEFNDFTKFGAVIYAPVLLNFYLMVDTGDGGFAPIPMQHLGMGIFKFTILGGTAMYGFDSDVGKLVYMGSGTDEASATSTYGLRKPSLADMINASLAERGLLKTDLTDLKKILPANSDLLTND